MCETAERILRKLKASRAAKIRWGWSREHGQGWLYMNVHKVEQTFDGKYIIVTFKVFGYPADKVKSYLPHDLSIPETEELIRFLERREE